MIISVRDAEKRPGEVFPIDLTEEIAPEEYAGRTVRFTEPARVSGSFVFDGKAFRVDAVGTVSYEAVCARCLKPFVETLSFPIREMFVRDTAWEEDGDAYPYTREQLDLKRAFTDDLFLSFPLVSVCKPDCKGLCPVCGRDRNTEPCTCQTEIGGGPLGALQQLLNEENKEV